MNLKKQFQKLNLIRICCPMVLALLVAACTSQNDNQMEGMTQIPVPDFPATLEDGEVLHYSDLYDDVRHVVLENRPDVLLGIPWSLKMEILPHQEILLFDRNTKNIVRFDSLGHYRNHIGCVGKSKAEYSSPIDILYDQYANQVVVLDNPGYLYYYTVDGEFVDKVHVPWYFGQLSQLGPDTLIIKTDQGDPIGPDGVGYNYCLFTKKGEVIAHFDPYGPELLYKQPDKEILMSRQEDKVYLREYASPVVYEMRADTILPVCQLNIPEANTAYFEKNRKMQKEMAKKFEEHQKQWEKETGQKSTSHYVIRPMHCDSFNRVGNRYFYSVSEGLSFLGIYDADKKTSKLYKGIVNDFIGPQFFDFSHVKDGYVYHLIDNVYSDNYLDGADVTEEEKKLFQQISDNIVLQVCKLKK